MNYSKELLDKAKTAKSAEELRELAKAENIELTEEQAADYFAKLNNSGELSDDELNNVAGGCDPGTPKYNVGDYVKYYYQYEIGWSSYAKSITSSTILDRKADGSTWMYKMATGNAEGDEFLPEDRIISLG